MISVALATWATVLKLREKDQPLAENTNQVRSLQTLDTMCIQSSLRFLQHDALLDNSAVHYEF